MSEQEGFTPKQVEMDFHMKKEQEYRGEPGAETAMLDSSQEVIKTERLREACVVSPSWKLSPLQAVSRAMLPGSYPKDSFLLVGCLQEVEILEAE